MTPSESLDSGFDLVVDPDNMYYLVTLFGSWYIFLLLLLLWLLRYITFGVVDVVVVAWEPRTNGMMIIVVELC